MLGGLAHARPWTLALLATTPTKELDADMGFQEGTASESVALTLAVLAHKNLRLALVELEAYCGKPSPSA